jgi:hypothetical protein
MNGATSCVPRNTIIIGQCSGDRLRQPKVTLLLDEKHEKGAETPYPAYRLCTLIPRGKQKGGVGSFYKARRYSARNGPLQSALAARANPNN